MITCHVKKKHRFNNKVWIYLLITQVVGTDLNSQISNIKQCVKEKDNNPVACYLRDRS